jgi:hypothetical protein
MKPMTISASAARLTSAIAVALVAGLAAAIPSAPAVADFAVTAANWPCGRTLLAPRDRAD